MNPANFPKWLTYLTAAAGIGSAIWGMTNGQLDPDQGINQILVFLGFGGVTAHVTSQRK